MANVPSGRVEARRTSAEGPEIETMASRPAPLSSITRPERLALFCAKPAVGIESVSQKPAQARK